MESYIASFVMNILPLMPDLLSWMYMDIYEGIIVKANAPKNIYYFSNSVH